MNFVIPLSASSSPFKLLNSSTEDAIIILLHLRLWEILGHFETRGVKSCTRCSVSTASTKWVLELGAASSPTYKQPTKPLRFGFVKCIRNRRLIMNLVSPFSSQRFETWPFSKIDCNLSFLESFCSERSGVIVSLPHDELPSYNEGIFKKWF